MSLILVDPVYNPELAPNITSDTKLGPGVTIAKFLGAYGDRTPFNHIRFDEGRRVDVCGNSKKKNLQNKFPPPRRSIHKQLQNPLC